MDGESDERTSRRAPGRGPTSVSPGPQATAYAWPCMAPYC